MRYLITIAATVAAMALIACGGGDGNGGDGNGGDGNGGNGNGEPSGEGLYQMMPTTPAGKAAYDVKKTVLFHNLSKLGDECFYSFRVVPDADEVMPDPDPFFQYIDVFYGNPGSTDTFDSRFVYQNVEYNFGPATPTRSPAEPSTEPLVVGGSYSSKDGESGSFDFILDPNLSNQMPPVTDCVE